MEYKVTGVVKVMGGVKVAEPVSTDKDRQLKIRVEDPSAQMNFEMGKKYSVSFGEMQPEE